MRDEHDVLSKLMTKKRKFVEVLSEDEIEDLQELYGCPEQSGEKCKEKK